MPAVRKAATARRTPKVNYQDAINALTSLTEKLDFAMFGHYDKEENREVPGLFKRFEDFKKDNDRRWRFALIGGGLLMTLGAADSVGIPTKEVGHFLASNFWNYMISHNLVTPP